MSEFAESDNYYIVFDAAETHIFYFDNITGWTFVTYVYSKVEFK